jgi:4-hydroxy-tetrahydrodipicolinate synthase
MYDLMFGGGNIELRDSLLPLMGWLFHEPNPIPLNTALAQLGIIRPIFR